jgi:hypothetical protein
MRSPSPPPPPQICSGQGCLISGPSGCGKSSLLRVMGRCMRVVVVVVFLFLLLLGGYFIISTLLLLLLLLLLLHAHTVPHASLTPTHTHASLTGYGPVSAAASPYLTTSALMACSSCLNVSSAPTSRALVPARLHVLCVSQQIVCHLCALIHTCILLHFFIHSHASHCQAPI